MAAVASQLASDLMRELGLTKAQAIGLVGNLAYESGGFTNLQEDAPVIPGSRGGYGYAQWTGPRRVAFENYAKANGLDPSSYEANLGFLVHELKGPENSALQAIKGATTADQAAKVAMNEFFRPGKPNLSARLDWADQVASDFTPVPGANIPAVGTLLDIARGVPPSLSGNLMPAVSSYRGPLPAPPPLEERPRVASLGPPPVRMNDIGAGPGTPASLLPRAPVQNDWTAPFRPAPQTLDPPPMAQLAGVPTPPSRAPSMTDPVGAGPNLTQLRAMSSPGALPAAMDSLRSQLASGGAPIPLPTTAGSVRMAAARPPSLPMPQLDLRLLPPAVAPTMLAGSGAGVQVPSPMPRVPAATGALPVGVGALMGGGAPVPVPPPIPQTRPTLPPRYTYSPATQALQATLNGLGYNSGATDGLFGPKTDAAVRAFQQANGLAVDGIVGPKTLAALNGATAPRTSTSTASRPSSSSSNLSYIRPQNGMTAEQTHAALLAQQKR